jgi:hypothetical protein
MEHFGKMTGFGTTQTIAVALVCYDTFVVWHHGPEQLQSVLSHLNSLRPTIQFTVETESDGAIPFLDVLVIRREMILATKVYRKPIHTIRNLNFKSNHATRVKRFNSESS